VIFKKRRKIEEENPSNVFSQSQIGNHSSGEDFDAEELQAIKEADVYASKRQQQEVTILHLCFISSKVRIFDKKFFSLILTWIGLKGEIFSVYFVFFIATKKSQLARVFELTYVF
jgi:hypothetical protein